MNIVKINKVHFEESLFKISEIITNNLYIFYPHYVEFCEYQSKCDKFIFKYFEIRSGFESDLGLFLSNEFDGIQTLFNILIQYFLKNPPL